MDTSDNSFHIVESEQSPSTISSDGVCCEVAVQNNEQLEEFPEVPLSPEEEKVVANLSAMELALRDDQGANLKLFWDIRRETLPLFQALETSARRGELWSRYVELTKEGRVVKALKDEEGAFLISQVDLAVTCLEKDVAGFFDRTTPIVPKKEACLDAQALESNRPFYEETLASFVWFGSFSSKILDLRKELMSMSIRMRLKSKFFQRLSVLGQQVFPGRKALVEKVSAVFAADVDAFVAKYFSGSGRDSLRRSVFFLRKEIKSLQQAAKSLAISSSVFSATRLKLSECWDQLKGLEKEIRQEQGRLRSVSTENTTKLRKLLEEATDLFSDDTSSASGIRHCLEGLVKQIREAELTHDDVVSLKKELHHLFERLSEREELEKKAHQEKQAKEEELKQEAIRSLENRVAEFVDSCNRGNLSEESRVLCQELQQAVAKMPQLPFLKKTSLNNQLNMASKHMAHFFEEQLLSSPDSREKLRNMREVLGKRLERRKELKSKLEQDKKLLGASGLDFSCAMQYSAMLEEDKAALEELDQSILSLKKQIQQLT